jgi:hypothetical protein
LLTIYRKRIDGASWYSRMMKSFDETHFCLRYDFEQKCLAIYLKFDYNMTFDYSSQSECKNSSAQHLQEQPIVQQNHYVFFLYIYMIDDVNLVQVEVVYHSLLSLLSLSLFRREVELHVVVQCNVCIEPDLFVHRSLLFIFYQYGSTNARCFSMPSIFFTHSIN